MKIVYADNNVEMLNKMESFLRDYCYSRNEPFEIELCTSPYELLDKLKTTVYDFLMLNVAYPEQGVSGLEISTKTRMFVPYTPTVFVETKSIDNVVLTLVYPRRYEMKPFSNVNFNFIMDDLYPQIFDLPLGCINVTTLDRHSEQIKVSEIVYAESTRKIISVYMYSGKCVKINGPMKNFIKKLSDFPEFLFPHQSFAVNSSFVSKITSDKIYLKNSNIRIPIARGKTQLVKEVYHRYFKITK